jgi:outer membrane protein assembly factor BamB
MNRAIPFVLATFLMACLPLPFLTGAQMEASQDGFSKAITLVQDARIQSNLGILPQYTGADGWPTAIGILQNILDADEDCFVPSERNGPDGKPVTVWVGARAEVLRLLAELPKEGRETYTLINNPRAKEELDLVRKEGNWRQLEKVAHRYPLTRAGLEASKLLGLHYLDRGNWFEAARWLELWLRRDPGWKDDGPVVCAAWLAFQRTQQSGLADMVLKTLQTKYANGVVLDNRKVSLAALRKQFEPSLAAKTFSQGWWLYGGSATRSAAAAKMPALEGAHWQAATVQDTAARALLENAVSLQQARSRCVLSGSFPITVGERLIYRAADGIHAVSLQTGKPVWDVTLPLSLERLFGDSATRRLVETWVGGYLSIHPHVLLGNSTLGCLSSDGQRVYVVDDLPVLPFASRYTIPIGRPADTRLPGSQLKALNASTGETVWETGNPGLRDKARGALDDCQFLGPPLPVQGKLYCLAEQRDALVLLGLEATTGQVLLHQRLAIPQNRVALDGGRRLQALHISHDRGMLICPTNAGAVLAYDLVTGNLAWAHAYRAKPLVHGPRLKGLRTARELEVESIPNMRSPWQVTAPVIHQGKVLHAAADSPVVECLSLDQGIPLWKSERVSDDLYLAGVHEGVVLVVGRKQCRGLRLEDGKELWRRPTGTPSGQGIFAGGAYWLPVKGAGPAQIGLTRIDVAQGIVAEPVALPGNDTPGNLVVAEGELISQSATGIAIYGSQKGK